jgi:uncharacterized protein YjbI with pentapeptide repeats
VAVPRVLERIQAARRLHDRGGELRAFGALAELAGGNGHVFGGPDGRHELGAAGVLIAFTRDRHLKYRFAGEVGIPFEGATRRAADVEGATRRAADVEGATRRAADVEGATRRAADVEGAD